jgi:uncharacterized protein YfcZ (UPF0381/DUF406 family)
MTPQEKADELYVGYWRLTNHSRIAKECALMTVNEIKTLLYNSDSMNQYDYWYEVKQEIEKL